MIVGCKIGEGKFLRRIELDDLERRVVAVVRADGRHRNILHDGRVILSQNGANAIQVRVTAYDTGDIVLIVFDQRDKKILDANAARFKFQGSVPHRFAARTKTISARIAIQTWRDMHRDQSLLSAVSSELQLLEKPLYHQIRVLLPPLGMLVAVVIRHSHAVSILLAEHDRIKRDDLEWNRPAHGIRDITSQLR